MDDLGKEYWSLANAITAFAVAQSLAFAYALAGDTGQKIRTKTPFVSGAILAAAFIFCVAVAFCNEAHIALAKPPEANQSILTATMVGRVVAILFYAWFGLHMIRTTGADSRLAG